MLPKKILTAGVLGLAMAAPAAAEEHVIVLTGFSYFPAITYADPGDTIRFVNESGGEETVVGKDVGWVVGPLQNAQQETIVVTEETELAFFSAYGSCSSGGGCSGDTSDPDAAAQDFGTYEDAEIRAEISFEEPDLSN